MTDDWTWPSRDRVTVRDDDCLGVKAIVPTDPLGAVAKDEKRQRDPSTDDSRGLWAFPWSLSERISQHLRASQSRSHA
jgi:hypothetical protein